MTFQQIREIKDKYQGLTLDTNQTHMFNNVQWASLWKLSFMQEEDMKDLIKDLDDNHLSYFFGRAGLHIQ